MRGRRSGDRRARAKLATCATHRDHTVHFPTVRPACALPRAHAADAPLSDEELRAVARKATIQSVAQRLAAESGPVAWAPVTKGPAEEAAMRVGDSALMRTVAAISTKDFPAAYQARPTA